ncbi:hypothetical protein CRYUN_Cryun01aG0034800 [Craigia yunnanensis]
MSRFRDRTEDFKDAVRHTAISSGCNESKLATIMASFIIHKLRQTTPFTKSALKTVELTSLLDVVLETETKMVEMSALNHLMSTHVLQQAQQTEHLYDQVVEATKNVELGNKELSQAIQRDSSGRTFLLLFLFVLTFSILFLDWYN